MWILVSPNGEISYSLTPGRIHSVSRKVGDIILKEDHSVSRKHASLEVNSPDRDGVSIWDESSKFGTYVDEGITSNVRIPPNEKITVKNGTRVRFGLQNNIWTLKKEIPCVCAHMLKAADKSKMKSVIFQIGGKVLDNWTENTSHLTTSSLRLTYEVMCALASAKPIVSPIFWQHYALMSTGKGPLADPSKFMPPVDDKRLTGRQDLCLPNNSRKSLLKDKLFIFPTSQSYQDYKNVVVLAGGKACKLSDTKMSLEDYCKPGVVVVSSADNQQTSFYNKVLSKVIEENLRVISEEDIGLALWKVSTAMHCNPSYIAPNFLHKSGVPQDTGATLVENTEDIGAASTGMELTDKVIPPSYSGTDFSTEDKTMSLSVQVPQPTTTPLTVNASTRKRMRGSTNGGIDKETLKSDPTPSAIKFERKSIGDEDLFADEVTQQSSGTVNISISNSSHMKKEKRPIIVDEEDDFLPSPPKKKKAKKSVEEDDDDPFTLPKMTPSASATLNKDDEDGFEFPEISKPSLNSSKVKKATSNVSHNESKDLFDESQEPTSSGVHTPKERGKRKERCDSDTENPPSKRPSTACIDVTNVHSSKLSLGFKGFQSVKKEEKSEPEDELAARFHNRVIITSLVVRKENPKNVTANSTVSGAPNFKKFRKAWSGSSSRDQISATIIHPTRGKFGIGNGSNVTQEDQNSEEDEDDPFLPQGTPRRTVSKSEDEDDEFALPSYSQV